MSPTNPPVKVVAGIIYRTRSDNTQQVLIAKRPLNKHQGGFWEFPGGKVDFGESRENALIRECGEELDIKVSNLKYFDKIDFNYIDKNVSITFYQVFNFSGTAKGNEGQKINWVNIADLDVKKFPEANRVIVEKLTMSD